MTSSGKNVWLADVLLFICIVGCRRSGSITPLSAPQDEPQNAAQSQVDPAVYRSVYAGQTISDPEDLSGVWQADDGHGGAVGIELTLTTFLPKDVVRINGVPEAWEALQAGVFHRRSSTIKLGDENFFPDSPQGGDLRYENGRLTLHAGWADLDLTRSSEEEWSGRLHWQDFDQQVVLTRTNSGLKKSPFAGTWRRQQDDAIFSCLHIVQTGEGTFSGWEDLHIVPALLRYAPYLKRPPGERQTYGRAILVYPEGADLLHQEPDLLHQGADLLHIDSPEAQGTCCPYSSIARLNGSVMQIKPSADPGLRGPWESWKRIPAGSCKLIPKRSRKKVPGPCPQQ